MNFSVLPPELNSARMFAGAGSGPLRTAAAAWTGLADELTSAATSFSSVTTGLADQAWQGPASQAMAQAAAPYAGWLRVAAAQAQGAGSQAQTVADVFEAARAATVHPAMVAANRNQFVSLVFSNLLGQNAPAIAAAEAQYEQMWAQDVAAMTGYYAGASAAVAQLPPWQQPLHNLATKLAGVLGLDPVTNPVPSDPDLMSQTTNLDFLSTTSLADPDDNFVATTIATPLFTASVTSGFESSLGLGSAGQTVLGFQTPLLPALNRSISLPVMDPLAPLFTALLPLGF